MSFTYNIFLYIQFNILHIKKEKTVYTVLELTCQYVPKSFDFNSIEGYTTTSI